MRAAIAYLAAGLAFAVVDAAWLTLVGPRLYRPALDPVLAERFALGPALAFYLIYVAGVLLLAILPTVRGGGDWPQAAMTGAVLGVVAYATYDLTNQATLKAWSLKITLADMLWGGFVTGLAAAAGFAAWRWADARLR